jgi:ATP-dependent Clp protease, protease subunit
MKKLMVFLVGMMLGVLTSSTSFSAEKAKKTITLTADNSLLLSDEVNGTSAALVSKEAQDKDSKLESGDPLYLVLSTPGGSIQDGLELIENLKGLNRPVHTITIFAASMGFQIAQQMNKRYITHFGTLMAHKAKGQFRGEFPGQIDSRYVYYVKRLNEMDRLTTERTKGKLTEKQFKDLYENEVWIDGFDTVSYGLADEVVGVKCDQSLSGTKNQTFNFMGFVVELVTAKCPTILGILDVKGLIATNKGLMEVKDFLAKGGTFDQPSEYNNYSNPFANGINGMYSAVQQPIGPVQEKLYAVTPGLTVEKIEEQIKKIRDQERDKRKAHAYKELY